MILWLTVAALAADDPAVNVTWKANQAELIVRPATGEHVAEDAPFDVDLRIGSRLLRVGGFGEDLAHGLRLGDVRGQHIEGDLSLSLCEDGGTRCRLVELHVSGAADKARRGAVALEVGPRRVARGTGFPARIDAQAAFEDALARAAREERPVLVDFGAVWCPPCQLMDAELFEAERRPSVVDAFVLVKLDVDDPSAWALKDRFDVTGYPTLVALEPDGTEIGRLLGYRSADDTVGWLDAVATGRWMRTASDPLPQEAAELAWVAVREGRLDQAAALLERAAGSPDTVAYRLARMHLSPTEEDAEWLAERAPGQAIAWVGAAGRVTETERGRAAVLQAIENDLPTAHPSDAADLLWYAAELARTPAEARVLYGAAAAVVRGRLTGDPLRDKGRYDQLAQLLERAGHPEEAVALLEEARAAFPDEPTFHHDLARMHLRQGHAAEALALAERALETAWGDNRLTAAVVKTRALVALGRVDEARAFVDRLLAEEPVPDEGVDVRTHRYRSQLRRIVDEADEPR